MLVPLLASSNSLHEWERPALDGSSVALNLHDVRTLRGVTPHRFTFTRCEDRSSSIFMHKLDIARRSMRDRRQELRYNELKTVILHVLTTDGWCDSNRIIERLGLEAGLSASPRAVRMALLRYHRHGLLHREWRHGEYVYKLSDRGASRLLWLKGLATPQPEVTF